jgi:hypothetical protein
MRRNTTGHRNQKQERIYKAQSGNTDCDTKCEQKCEMVGTDDRVTDSR